MAKKNIDIAKLKADVEGVKHEKTLTAGTQALYKAAGKLLTAYAMSITGRPKEQAVAQMLSLTSKPWSVGEPASAPALRRRLR